MNEHCIDAVNLTDFIESLHIQLKDLENTKSNGLNLAQLESGASSDSNYDLKAPKSFIYKLDGYQLVSNPIKNKQHSIFS